MRKWNYDMSTAPKDGTVVEVMETPNGEHINMFYARWHTPYYSQDVVPPNPHPSWWGVSFSTGYHEWSQQTDELYGRPYHVCCHPFAWRELPKPPKNAMKKYIKNYER